MVMSMDTYADQTMSSPPLPSNEDSAASPSAIMSSPLPFQQQESADDEHDDEHSKGSNQTVVAKHQEQHLAQLRDNNDSKTQPIVDERVASPGADEQHHEKMIVSRGSSFDGDKKLEMNVDDESNEESSMRTNLKFDPLELNAKLAQQAKTTVMPSDSKVESSLVAQMRDIVEGGSSRTAPDQKRHINEQGRQPRSSNDSLNNQNDNNTSKTSLDSVTGHKRTRHSRAHQCRHHHNHHHHHQHRHRQSISAASITGSQVDSGLAPASNTGTNASHSHYIQHHHHHRHSNTGHTHPQHHHHHHHSGHHHHHHHKGGTSSKRNSIQKLALNDSVSNQQQQQQQQQGKNESNSSVSSVSLTKQGQQGNNVNQSQPESGKSSGSPSDEQIIDTELQESSQNQQASRDGHHHHHNHHHHCHHRSHKKRLVLDAGNNQPEAVAKSEDSSYRRKPLQDSTSGMNVEPAKYHQHAHHQQPNEHGHHHHHHHHAHHHHHHPHHHHTHSIHCADYQASSNKNLTDPSQQQAVGDGSHQHHHHQRHHKHHHNHNHHGHHCRHNRHRARGRSGSKANNSLRDSGKNLDTVDADQVTTERRFSSHSVATGAKRDDEQSAKNDEGELLVDGNKDDDDDVVNMDVSPKSARKASQVLLSNQSATVVVSDINSRPGLDDANKQGDALHDAEIGAGTGAGDTSRKHDSSCNIQDQTIQANQENIDSRGVGTNEDGHNRLSRQISSQSSKKSQKDSLHGAGQNQQDQRHNECAEPSLQVAGANQQASRPRQIIESSVTGDRRCRLCWCCCCPCSALNVREAPDRSVDKNKSTSGPPSSPTSKYPSPPNVSLDEIRSWGESFDKLMKCIDGRKVFQDFLRCEYSEENILFWSACEELKKEKDSKSVAAKARDIYEDYISILSSKEVSLDSRVRDVINNNIKKPTSNIFDEAQLQIYTLMHRDSYPRFINSGMYKKLAQITTSNSRKSSS